MADSQAPEAQATETPAGSEGAAAQATPEEQGGATAATIASPTPQLDWQTVRKQFAGHFGREIEQERKRVAEQERQRIVAEIEAQRRAEEEQRRLLQLDGDDYKAEMLRRQNLDRLQKQYESQGFEYGRIAAYNDLVAAAFEGLPQEEQDRLRSTDWQGDHRAFLRATYEAQTRVKAEMELEQRAKELEQKLNERLEREMEKLRADANLSAPKLDLATGNPSGPLSVEDLGRMSLKDFEAQKDALYRQLGL